MHRLAARLLLLLVFPLFAVACSSSDGSAETVPAPDVPEETTSLDLPALAPEVVDEVAVEVAETVGPFVCRDEIPIRTLDNNPDETFDLGPYLMVPTDTAITIKWRTLEEEDGTVLYGLLEPGEFEVSEEGTRHVHNVRLKNLLPGTRYAYRVRSGDRESATHHFYTAPPVGGSFQFAAWGDNQGGEGFPLVVDAILADNPHMLIGVGDHVHDGRIDILWKDHLFDPARALFHELPWYAAFGNHGKNGKLYYQLMGYENIALSAASESMFSYTYGNAFFLVIDTNGLFYEIAGVDTEWSTWVKEQVASPAALNATWRIAYGHEPGAPKVNSVAVACAGDEHWVNPGNEHWFFPLLQEHGFHAYFAGHVHIYERTMTNNLLQVITGGGGGGLDECEGVETEVSVLARQYHYLRGKVGCDTLRIEAVDVNGDVFDFVELGPEPGTIIDQGPFPANL